MIYNNYRYSFFNEDDDMSTDDETVEVDVDELEGKDYSDTATVAESVYLAMYEDAHNWNQISDILNEESILDKVKNIFDTIIKTIKEWIENIIGIISGFIDKLRKKFFAIGLKTWLKDNKDKLLKSKTVITSYTGYRYDTMNKFMNQLIDMGIINGKFFTSTLDSRSIENTKGDIEDSVNSHVRQFAGKDAVAENVSPDDIMESLFGSGETEITAGIPSASELSKTVDGYKSAFNNIIKLQNQCKKSGKEAIDAVNKVRKDLVTDDAREAGRKCMKVIRLGNRWNTVVVNTCFKIVNYQVKLTLDLCKVYVSGKSSGNIIVKDSKNESATFDAFNFV